MAQYLPTAFTAVAVLCTAAQVGFLIRLAAPAIRTRLLPLGRS